MRKVYLIGIDENGDKREIECNINSSIGVFQDIAKYTTLTNWYLEYREE